MEAQDDSRLGDWGWGGTSWFTDRTAVDPEGGEKASPRLHGPSERGTDPIMEALSL